MLLIEDRESETNSLVFALRIDPITSRLALTLSWMRVSVASFIFLDLLF